jgi:hypothetical protein
MAAKKPYFDLPVQNIPGVNSIRLNSRLVISFWDNHVATAYGQTYRTPLLLEQLQTAISAAD